MEMARRGISAALSYPVALAVLLAVSNETAVNPVLGWAVGALFIALLGLRVVLRRAFDRIYARSTRLWSYLQTFAITLTALSWGMVSAASILNHGESWTSMIAALITLGMCAGAPHSIGISLPVTRIYLLAILAPNIAVSLMLGGTPGMTLVTVFLVSFFYCLAQGRNVHREFWASRIKSVRLDSDTRDRLHRLTYHDTLTNLPNRELFNDRLSQAINDARRRSTVTAVMVLGLDRFSQINDTLGHQAGDELLKQTALRVQSCIREHDTLARYSGDVFAIILPNLNEARNAARVAGQVLEKMAEPFEIAGLELFVTMSIGISLYPVDSQTDRELIKNAEGTMYRVKQQGGDSYQYFENRINDEAMERLHMETRLRRALERNEFRLCYQPKVDLSTGQLCGFEALLRWYPDEVEAIPPAKFIPILEDTGLIVPVGEWVLRTACAQNRAWHNAGFSQVRMAVNLSARQFRDRGLADLVSRVLSETHLAPQWLELEITESMIMDNTDQTMSILGQLHAMGIHLAIDDFGTGYSSLAYLTRMPIKTLKIDRSFVKDVTTDQNDATLVQTIIAMAHNLNLRVVAEGAETRAQVAFLREQQCDETQGFYFSRPLPATELYDMLHNGVALHDKNETVLPDNTILLYPRQRA